MNLNNKMELMEKKLFCLVKIKSELTSQLRERNQHIQFLEKELSQRLNLENNIDNNFIKHHTASSRNSRKYFGKSVVNNIKTQFNSKAPSKSVSMPEKLDSISMLTSRNKTTPSFIKAIKKKAKSFASPSRKHRSGGGDVFRNMDKVSNEVQSQQYDDNASFISRWSVGNTKYFY